MLSFWHEHKPYGFFLTLTTKPTSDLATVEYDYGLAINQTRQTQLQKVVYALHNPISY